MQYRKCETPANAFKAWKRTHDVHARYNFEFDAALLEYPFDRERKTIKRTQVTMTQKANPAEKRILYVWPEPIGTGFAFEMEIVTDSDRYAMHKAPIYFQAFMLEWSLRRRALYNRVPKELKDAIVGKCPLCGGDLIRNAYHVGGKGPQHQILTQCFGALGDPAVCDNWDNSYFASYPPTKRLRALIVDLEQLERTET